MQNLRCCQNSKDQEKNKCEKLQESQWDRLLIYQQQQMT